MAGYIPRITLLCLFFGLEPRCSALFGVWIMVYHLDVIRVMLLLGLKRALQYRWDFLIEGGLSLVTAVLQLLPLLILFSERHVVAGWSSHQMLVLMGWYIMLRALIEGIIAPSLVASVSGVRTGLFDYTIIKPMDTMFLCSFAAIKPWKVVDFLFGIALIVFAFSELNIVPSFLDVSAAFILSLAGVITVYALFVLATAISFVVVRIQNLTEVLSSLLDFARWPVQIFDPAWRLIFSVLIPLGVMTTYPCMALLGTLTLDLALHALVMVALSFALARFVWTRSFCEYCSASS